LLGHGAIGEEELEVAVLEVADDLPLPGDEAVLFQLRSLLSVMHDRLLNV
jgi:hypothetical protein